jgi:hypothetical protein
MGSRGRACDARDGPALLPKELGPALPQKKWGPALLPAPTAPSEGYAGIRNLVHSNPKTQTNPLSILAHQLRRRFPSNSSLLKRSPIDLPGCAARRFAGRSIVPACLGISILANLRPAAKTARCSTALLGETTLASRFASSAPKCFPKPRRARGEFPLPAPLPDWPRLRSEELRHCLPAEIGSLATCRSILPLPAFRRGWGRSPDHPCTMRSLPESGKRKMR